MSESANIVEYLQGTYGQESPDTQARAEAQ
jgi:hypothetical protein